MQLKPYPGLWTPVQGILEPKWSIRGDIWYRSPRLQWHCLQWHPLTPRLQWHFWHVPIDWFVTKLPLWLQWQSGYSDTFGMSQLIGLLLNYLSGYSDNLVTVTLFPCPEGVTVRSGDLCTMNFFFKSTHEFCSLKWFCGSLLCPAAGWRFLMHRK